MSAKISKAAKSRILAAQKARWARIKSAPAAAPENPVRTCVHCGCTDDHACPGGCSWAIQHTATPTGVCSQCVPKEITLVDSL
jgi:hypothetical protein